MSFIDFSPKLFERFQISATLASDFQLQRAVTLAIVTTASVLEVAVGSVRMVSCKYDSDDLFLVLFVTD